MRHCRASPRQTIARSRLAGSSLAVASASALYITLLDTEQSGTRVASGSPRTDW